MADFDNGLPPTGTTTDGKVTDILMQSEPYQTVESNIIPGVLFDKTPYETVEPVQIRAVLLDKQAAGLNYGTFL
jgi:hypothetical protein